MKHSNPSWPFAPLPFSAEPLQSALEQRAYGSREAISFAPPLPVTTFSALHYHRDEATVASGNTFARLGATPYEGSVKVYKSGLLLSEVSDYSVSSKAVLFFATLTAGHVYTFEYWTLTASPAATAFATPGELAAKLTSFWNMSEATNTTRSDSITTNHAVVSRGTVPAGTGPKGGADVAATFSADKLNAGYAASTRINTATKAGGGSHCLFGWIYVPSFGNQFVATAWDAGSAASMLYQVAITSSGNIAFQNGGSPSYSSVGVAMSAAAWHFVVGWRDDADGKLRISVDDGTPVVSTTVTTLNRDSSTLPLMFGGSAYTGDANFQKFTGRLSRWGWIKGDILTPDEITDIYNGGPAGALSYSDIALL